MDWIAGVRKVRPGADREGAADVADKDQQGDLLAQIVVRMLGHVHLEYWH